jgi:hypothetical protein
VIGLVDFKNPINLLGIGLMGIGAFVSFTNGTTLISNNCFGPGMYTALGLFSVAGGLYLIKVYSDNWTDEATQSKIKAIQG